MVIDVGKIGTSLSKLSEWFQTMQMCKGAYGGPVVHWWLCSFIYCGPGANWTYEGLIEAFLTLHNKTKREVWLKRATDAANYLTSIQMPDGTYRYSFFEYNPLFGSSSVHEASVDLALISLASYLENIGEDGGKYFQVALRNAEESLYQHLWDSTIGTFRSTDNITLRSSYVFNIMATVAQVFLRLYSRTSRAQYRDLASSTLSYILQYQRKKTNDVLFGSFPQGLHDNNAYVLYNARIVTFLLEAYKILKEEATLEAAERCSTFLRKLEREDGGFSFLVTRKGRIYDYPNLIGGIAETVRALTELRNVSENRIDFNEEKHIKWLLRFQDAVGGFRTAVGFHYDVLKTDYKDLFHVCGWNDKIFRLLASLFRGHNLKRQNETPMKKLCWIGKTKAFFVENSKEVTIQNSNGNIVYRWSKGENLCFVDNRYLGYFMRISPAQSILGYDIRSVIRL